MEVRRMIITDDLPCNCRQCHVCAILGIACPLPKPVAAIVEPERQPEPRPAPKPVATLFDFIPMEV